MSDLWDYGTSSSEDDPPVVSNADDDGTERDLGRYMSLEQKKKYQGVLHSAVAPEDITLAQDRRRAGDVGDIVLLDDDDDDDEDAFEALWRKEKEELIAVPEYVSDDNEGVEEDTVRRSERPKRKRGRPPKNAKRGGEGSALDAVSPGNPEDASRVHTALRAFLENDDVSDVDVASDEDEDLRRIKEMKEKRAKRELDAEVQLVSECRLPAEGREESGEGAGGVGGSEMIELRFVDRQRHEFVTDAVPTSTFDFPCSKFVSHAIAQGWIKSEDDILQFVFDDEVLIRTEHNPQMYDMEDGDTIDVHYV